MSKAIRYDIQLLRAVAVVAVMLFHMDREFLPAGFLGVDIFFTISGFVVTQSLLHRIKKGMAENPQFSWKDKLRIFWGFMVSRAKRILPAYYFVLLVVTVTAIIVFTETDFGFYRRSLRDALYFNSNVFFQNFGDYFAPQSTELPLLHTWSLAVEMKFYLLLPLVFMIAGRKWSPFVLGLVFVGLMALISYQEDTKYYYLYSRIPEFLIGVGIAIVGTCRWSRGLRWMLALAGIGVVFWSFFFIKESSIPGIWMLLPCAATALVIWADIGLSRGLLVRALSYVGDISYSLYLWHWAVLAFIRYISSNYELTSGLVQLYFGLSVGLSILSYHIIEQPFRKFKTNKILLGYLIVMLGILITLLSIIGKNFNNTLVKPLPIELRRYADPDTICHDAIVGDCIRGDQNSSHRILVIGDSHAAQLNKAFDEIGLRKGVAFKVLTASNCIPIEGFDIEKIPEYSQDECSKRIDIVREEINSQFDQIIIAGFWSYQLDDDFIKTFKDFLQKVNNSGKKVILLAQTPLFPSNSERIDRFFALKLDPKTDFHNSHKVANTKLKALVDSNLQNIYVLDFSDDELFKDAPHYGNKLIIFDGEHLNEFGSSLYGKVIENKILEIFRDKK